jgi:hypothetical protein
VWRLWDLRFFIYSIWSYTTPGRNSQGWVCLHPKQHVPDEVARFNFPEHAVRPLLCHLDSWNTERIVRLLGTLDCKQGGVSWLRVESRLSASPTALYKTTKPYQDALAHHHKCGAFRVLFRLSTRRYITTTVSRVVLTRF